jgi:hypothetical protein
MKIRILISLLIISKAVFSQNLKPYFDKSEYIELLKINRKAHISKEKWANDTAVSMPENYEFYSRSAEVGFDNLFDLWLHKEQPIAVISVRGSIATEASFLANFYAAMIPAKGEIQINDDFNFKYKLAENSNAAVHVGWLISMASLSNSIKSKIDSCYNIGIKDFLLTGHSQGGGITYLLTAYLKNLQKGNELSKDIHFKTYCSAGPKPGNLFFAYEYEKLTEGGWAFNVVNSVDWVPDVPFSLQTINDYTEVNPFSGAKKAIKKQKLLKRLVLKHAYNKLSKPSIKAQKNYEKYLGEMVSKAVKKQFPSIKLPDYYNSNYYVRTGTTIVLMPDEEYFEIYPEKLNNNEIWIHHFIEPYLFLVNSME